MFLVNVEIIFLVFYDYSRTLAIQCEDELNMKQHSLLFEENDI